MRSLAPFCAAVLIAGCQQPAVPTTPTVRYVSVHTPDEFTALWDASQDTLREHLLVLDRRDLRERVVTTFPETSQYPGEFWRRDVATAYDWGEAALATVRRRVTVRIADEPLPAKLAIDVEVQKERFNTTERDINDAAAALHSFSTRAPTTRGAPFDPDADAYWQAMGRDGAMETVIADRIVKHFAARTGS